MARDKEKHLLAVKNWNRLNPHRIKEWHRQRRARNAEIVRNYLAVHHCVDCGESDPVVLDFDHREPARKRFAISQRKGRCFSLETLMTEIEKCDVRCANCHRRKTHRDRVVARAARFERESSVLETEVLAS